MRLKNLLLGIVRGKEVERFLHVYELLRQHILLVEFFLNRLVLDFQDVLQKLPARVDPVQVKSDASSQHARLQVLQLQPLVMLVLVNEQIELHFSVPVDDLAITILDLDVKGLTSGTNVKGDDLFPDWVATLRESHICI